jgi:hypothetical protein
VWTERERRALRESSGRPRFRLPCQAGPHRPDRRFRRRPTEQERLRAKLHKARGEEE